MPAKKKDAEAKAAEERKAAELAVAKELAEKGKLDSPIVEPEWSAAPPLTKEEADEEAEKRGMAPYDYSTSVVRPVTDPAPTMSPAQTQAFFNNPAPGGKQPDWYDGGVVRVDRMDKSTRPHFEGLSTVGEATEEGSLDNPSAMPAPGTPAAPVEDGGGEGGEES